MNSSLPSKHTSVVVTYIGTATAIIEIEGVTFLTDPYFSPDGTSWEVVPGVFLTSHYTPALGLSALPPIDVVLLSHEDHPDNLDEVGRRLLDGRIVFTTTDGARKLAPRPGVRGLKPWETVRVERAGKTFEITGTPCRHLPGGECTGFVLSTANLGMTDGRPNAIYFSGDTVYIEELAGIRGRFHVSVALLNIGAAAAAVPGMKEPLLITMDGRQAAQLHRDMGADVMIPLHFECWDHFTEDKAALQRILETEGISANVRWLDPGVATRVI
ncbi:hypothetical protein PFICI_15178 [Pestalotiopsis fici W106-1]|uniref:Metallo-beta-lactamase domain-containing protein n=1 Tax=Pestalotiopsis fici (strain W106-1 / CGMCC3.15140) TaxID=1229662 RepID=W3WGG7_PESFW|nr:uncharacterized protein PFICI_15178 [Pestalotiopsis fici W106-1]ETS73003.1 hypothetical protein PFICI_15178 [Pestalotiopsis fici W106-1]